ncbi:MAG: flagellin [Spirochaetaceae bacterium]|nr:MAG: flagellin [Spirochaetaceae bacterium]
MIINHNISAMYANRLLRFKGKDVTSDIEKLSSGMRINKAGDDASGLAVSEKLRSQVRGLVQAGKNIENAISFIQTSEGYLQETQDILHRMRELAVQSANGIYSDEDRMQIQVEVSQLVDEVNRIAEHAEFNGMKLLTGRFARSTGENTVTGSMWFQVGANVDQREQAFIGTMTAQALGLQGAQGSDEQISIQNPDEANKTIATVDSALTVISKQRADLGAYQNRFEHAARGVAVAAENMQAAESLIRDTDMAEQMTSFVKNQILVQSGTAMLAQANLKNQAVLQLLG